MHPALRRYADPPRTFVPLFGLGVFVGVLAISIVSDRIAAFDRKEAQPERFRDEGERLAKVKEILSLYAYQAFPAWAVDHPERACPAERAELDIYVRGSGLDPSGHPITITCDPGGRLIAWSVGPDGEFPSADDVSSR